MKKLETAIQWNPQPGLICLTWPRWVVYLSPRYGYVILVSGYLLLTVVNWPSNGSLMSNFTVVIDLYIFFGRHLAWLRRLINILRVYIWARDMIMWHWSAGFLFWQLFVKTAVKTRCKPLCNLKFTKLSRLRSPYWCYTVVVFDVVEDSTRPWALPLAILHMKKETLGFHNLYAWFYAWFSSVSPISIGMGLRSPVLRAGEALLSSSLICLQF